MFLRRYTRNKDGKAHTYYALVESVRTAAGPRQHVVAYLGELNHDQQGRWQRTVVIYNRQGDRVPPRLLRKYPLRNSRGLARGRKAESLTRSEVAAGGVRYKKVVRPLFFAYTDQESQSILWSTMRQNDERFR